MEETSKSRHDHDFVFSYVFVLDSFAIHGNVLDLAIGIVIGAAFSNVVQSLVNDIITPPLGLVLAGVDFSHLTIKMDNFVHKDQPPVVIRYGKFIQTIITLLIVALILLFVAKGANKLMAIAAKKKEKMDIDSKTEVPEDVKILREIRDLLIRRPASMKSICIRI